jgi:zinc protease
MSSKIEPAMSILADLVRNPVFQDEEIERLRQQYLDSLNVAMNEPGSVANYVAARVVFGDAAYGHPLSGTTKSIAQIKRDDIVGLHSKFYRPDNAVLVIGGDIKAEDAFKLAEKTFGDWAKPSAEIPARGQVGKMVDKNEKPRVVVVDMPDAGQASVVLARTGISRSDPDYFRGNPRSSARSRSISASFCCTRSKRADCVLIPSSIKNPAASARLRKTPAWTSCSSLSCASGETLTATT